jgi:GT2 family glycosyltransferase
MNDVPYISIIVPVYNAENTIIDCIESLLKVDYPEEKLEIIIVDDCSSDKTPEILKHYAKEEKVNVIRHRKNKGAAAARNTGFKYAKGKIIVFTDSDCIVSENWIKELVKCYNSDIGAVGGKFIPYNLDNLIAKFSHGRNLVTEVKAIQNENRIIEIKNGLLPSANLSFRREVFEELNGFDERFRKAGGEDRDICYRLLQKGYKLIYNPKAVVYHKHRDNIRSFFMQNFTYAYYRELVKKKHKYYRKRKLRLPFVIKFQRFLGLTFLLFVFYLISKNLFLGIFLLLLLPYIVYLPLAYKISKKVNDTKMIFIAPLLSFISLIAWQIGSFKGKHDLNERKSNK